MGAKFQKETCGLIFGVVPMALFHVLFRGPSLMGWTRAGGSGSVTVVTTGRFRGARTCCARKYVALLSGYT